MTIPPADAEIQCSRCGEVFARRYLTGIGSNHRMTWLCGNCVINGGADETFGAIGKRIQRQIDDAIEQEQQP